jgi:hypothetical protein
MRRQALSERYHPRGEDYCEKRTEGVIVTDKPRFLRQCGPFAAAGTIEAKRATSLVCGALLPASEQDYARQVLPRQ